MSKEEELIHDCMKQMSKLSSKRKTHWAGSPSSRAVRSSTRDQTRAIEKTKSTTTTFNNKKGIKKARPKVGSSSSKADIEKITASRPAIPRLETIRLPATFTQKKMAAPPMDMTGVSPAMTHICAAISGQIYSANAKEDFRLDYSNSDFTSVVEVLEYNDQGDYAETVPPFVLCKTDTTTLIIGWRGSQTVLDWTADFNASPVVAPATYGIRMQSSFLSLVQSDFALHGDKIAGLIAKHKITRVIFTGHSLAGALATVALVLVTAQIHNHSSSSSETTTTTWDPQVEYRSLTFSAPMSIAIEPDTPETAQTILDKAQSFMCNIIYSYDPVPRSYSMIDFLLNVVNAVIDDIGWGAGWALKKFLLPNDIVALLEKGYDQVTPSQKKSLDMLFKMLFRFRHLGRLVYYESAQADPVAVVDKGPFHEGAERTVKCLDTIGFPLNKVAPKEVADTHNFLVTQAGLAYNIPEKEILQP